MSLLKTPGGVILATRLLANQGFVLSKLPVFLLQTCVIFYILNERQRGDRFDLETTYSDNNDKLIVVPKVLAIRKYKLNHLIIVLKLFKNMVLGLRVGTPNCIGIAAANSIPRALQSAIYPTKEKYYPHFQSGA